MNPSYLLLYVTDVAKSAELYSQIFSTTPVEQSPGFALFALDTLRVGLWRRENVEPAVTAPAGGLEIGFAVETDGELEATLQNWTALGLTLLQPIEAKEFGLTMTMSDPDGHRLRAFVPAQ
ncbi:hypothetical protein BJF93_02655 [Xaviernesmea oryzae]|uniref:VOC domain-containing protein n=1 Tax=Xaviernesmea oryzae TaxID=464029 RepID=A0A1Q9AZ65_9HYPH|nr:VOC family protein [Xaviernesmea oryzae]OLP60985.1 hypothetical protein BJF93_02655 [Xaviernesmea oryzae]SEL18757.1 Glyoxalase-like domain-containing protein [Xaviernesmea oryzae]